MKQHSKPIEQHTKPGDRARVEQRQQEFRIIGFESRELVEFPDLVSDDDAEIPERVQERAQEPPVPSRYDHRTGSTGRYPNGITPMPPAITAEREHDELVRLPACVG